MRGGHVSKGGAMGQRKGEGIEGEYRMWKGGLVIGRKERVNIMFRRRGGSALLRDVGCFYSELDEIGWSV